MIIIPDGLSYDKKVRTGSLSVRNVAFTSVRNNWIHKERFLYANEFIFVTDGTVHIKADGRVYDIEKTNFSSFRSSAYSPATVRRNRPVHSIPSPSKAISMSSIKKKE